MNLQNFLNYFNGIYCDYDGTDGCQCFDLANYYSRWIGGQQFSGATADLIYNQTQNGFYTQIPNTPTDQPQAGDIVVFNWPHVGIATGNNTNSNQFELLEQNDPEGSNCHIKLYTSYEGVIGWLRPVTLPQDQSAIISQCNADRDTNWNAFVSLCSALGVTPDPSNKSQTVTTATAVITTLKDDSGKLTIAQNDVSNCNTQVLNLQTTNKTLQDQVNQLTPIQTEYNQLQQDYNTDKINWNAQFTKDKQTISQLENSSINTLPLGELIKGFLARIFHLS